jgi:hypothetical protein
MCGIWLLSVFEVVVYGNCIFAYFIILPIELKLKRLIIPIK